MRYVEICFRVNFPTMTGFDGFDFFFFSFLLLLRRRFKGNRGDGEGKKKVHFFSSPSFSRTRAHPLVAISAGPRRTKVMNSR